MKNIEDRSLLLTGGKMSYSLLLNLEEIKVSEVISLSVKGQRAGHTWVLYNPNDTILSRIMTRDFRACNWPRAWMNKLCDKSRGTVARHFMFRFSLEKAMERNFVKEFRSWVLSHVVIIIIITRPSWEGRESGSEGWETSHYLIRCKNWEPSFGRSSGLFCWWWVNCLLIFWQDVNPNSYLPSLPSNFIRLKGKGDEGNGPGRYWYSVGQWTQAWSQFHVLIYTQECDWEVDTRLVSNSHRKWEREDFLHCSHIPLRCCEEDMDEEVWKVSSELSVLERVQQSSLIRTPFFLFLPAFSWRITEKEALMRSLEGLESIYFYRRDSHSLGFLITKCSISSWIEFISLISVPEMKWNRFRETGSIIWILRMI